MAITYNAESAINVIKKWNGAAWTEHAGGTTVFDYFEDTAGVGDAIYIGRWTFFKDIKFFVGTPLVAAAITVAWEYWNELTNTWDALPGLVDRTNAFQNAGQNWVEFDHTLMEYWDMEERVNGEKGVYIRCRITAVTAITEGGAQSTQTVTVGDLTVLVTGAGNDFADLLAADVGGGWGVITKQGDKQYFLNCHLYIGDGVNADDLTDDLVQVEIGAKGIGYTAKFSREWQVNEHAVFQLGNLNYDGYAGDYGGRGCSFKIWTRSAYRWIGYTESKGTIKFYGVTFNHYGYIMCPYITGAIDFRDCILTGYGHPFYACGLASIMTRCTFYGMRDVMFYSGDIVINDVVIENQPRALVCGWNVHVVARRLTISDNCDEHFRGRSAGSAQHFSLYDCNWDEEKYYVYAASLTYIDDYKSFNLKVLDRDGVPINGATVTIEDALGGTTVLATNASGDIVEQDLHIAHYLPNGTGNGMGSAFWTKTDYNPYTVTVEMGGYRIYISELQLIDATSLIVALAPTGGGPPGALVEAGTADVELTTPGPVVVEAAE